MAIVPLRPLDEASHYYVVITHDLKSSNGKGMGVSSAYALAKGNLALVDGGGISQNSALTDAQAQALEPLRQLVNTSESFLLAGDTSLSLNEIILSWSFTTQSVGDVLTKVRTDLRAGAAPASALVDSGSDSPLTAADIWVGTVDIPYYLTAASGVNDPTPLGTFWQGASSSNLTRLNPTPIATSTQSIPLMVSIPKTAAGAIPLVIYQHGITTNRATMLAVADSMAAAGMAVAAIDLPLHGLTGLETDGTQAFKTGGERTFDLNLVTQDVTTGAITAATPDAFIDSSGRHFINLTHLLNTRDNVRQGVADLMALTYAMEGKTIGAVTIDASRIYFLGHSLGAMVGTTFVALESNVRDSAFAFGAGSYAKVLDGSKAFGAEIAAGLAANGVTKGTADFESFIGAAQTVVDTVDPINHATAAATGRGILFFEIVGGANNLPPSDLVVPNTVPDANDTAGTVAAPLAGTEPLLTLMGITQVNSDQTGADLKHSVKFVVGNHSSLLSAAADAFNDGATNTAVRTEIQTIAATFLASDGASVNVDEAQAATLLQAP